MKGPAPPEASNQKSLKTQTILQVCSFNYDRKMFCNTGPWKDSKNESVTAESSIFPAEMIFQKNS
jgi:hypothetical protein